MTALLIISWRHAALKNQPEKETEIAHQQSPLQTLAEIYRRWCIFVFPLGALAGWCFLVLRFGVLRDNLKYEFHNPSSCGQGRAAVSDTQRSNAFQKKVGGSSPVLVTLFLTTVPTAGRKIIQIDLADRSSIETASVSCLTVLRKRLNALSTMPVVTHEDDVRMDSINTEMDVWDHVFQVNFLR